MKQTGTTKYITGALICIGMISSAHAAGPDKFATKGQGGDSVYAIITDATTGHDPTDDYMVSDNEAMANGDWHNEAENKAIDRARKRRVMSPYQLAMVAAAKDAVSALNKMEKVNNAAKMPELSARKVRQTVWQSSVVPSGLGRIVSVDKMMTITEFTRFIARLVNHEGYRVVYPRRIVPDPLVDLRSTRGRIVDVLRIAGNQMGDRLDIVITPKKKGATHGVIELIANGETADTGYSLVR